MSFNASKNYRDDDFARTADGREPTVFEEAWDLVRLNRKWFLIPILLMLAAAGLFIVLSSTVFAPFIYPLF